MESNSVNSMLDENLIKLVLIEDNALFAQSISIFLRKKLRYKLLKHYEDCENALSSDELKEANILLLDIKLPQMSGLDALPIIRKKYPKLKVIMLTAFESDTMLFEALKKGATGYILKADYLKHIENAIEQVLLGGMLFSPSMAQVILNYFQPKPALNKNNLTPRENEVLQLLRKGNTKKQMADVLNISYNTVDTHVKNIYKKLNVNSNIEATQAVLT